MLEKSDFEKLEDEVKQAYNLFLDYYNNQRNLEKVISLFSPEITNIGSADDEYSTDFSSVLEMFKRDIQQCPCKIQHSEKSLKISILDHSHALLITSFDSSTIIDDIPLEINGYRFSILWERNSIGSWLIRHLHLSKGESALRPGESYPLTEIEEQNKVLEKLVNKRTKELCKANIELSSANKEIAEGKQRFETIFEKASDGIIISDWKKHNFFMINLRLCKILGYTREELLGKWFDELIPKEDISESMRLILEESNKQIPVAGDIPMICKNKEIRYFDITSQSMVMDGKNYLASLYRDITDHKKSDSLREKAESAQKASETKNLFMANLSHEIRTPLTGIIGMSEILSKTPLTSQQTNYLNIISESSKVLLALINDILDISKIEAGKITIKKSEFTVNELIHSIKTISRAGLQEKSNTLDIKLLGNVPRNINTDRMRLEQVIMNLLNNAIKFTQNGSIALTISLDDQSSGKLKITVKDTGIGIDEKYQEKLFQKFQKFSNGTSGESGGSGLGLFISRQLVTLLGGDIGLKSMPGKGSTFWFTFATDTIQKEFVSVDDNEYLSDVPLNMNVLLVDDKRVNLQVISLMLQTAMCTIDTANNGLEAVEKFEPGKYDMILMDIMMPIMDGISAMKELRRRNKDLPPIIAITANAMAGDKEKYIAEGFDSYIPKPVTMEKLTSELSRIGILSQNNKMTF